VRTRRLRAGEYQVIDSRTAQIVGSIVCDGRPGVDNYPWTWVVTFPLPVGVKSTGPADTKRSALNQLLASWDRR
jgi:hypothetical protein